MAKYYGAIGFATQTGVDGIWTETITEHMYCGELVRNSRSLQSADKVNDDITVSNEISIIADPYATENFQSIRYATFMGHKWKVVGVDVNYPRLTLKLGGIYNV